MKKIVILVVLLLQFFSHLEAFPTALYWTVATTDVVPTNSITVAAADYFTIFNRKRRGQVLPTDVGATLGIFTCGKWAGEVGFDYFGGVSKPLFFNAKVRVEEHAYNYQMPSFSVGIFEVGTGPFGGQYVFDIVFGKTLLDKSRFFLGGYWGNNIGKNPAGILVGYIKGFCHRKDCEGNEYDKWAILADYASGKNLQGGGGVGVLYSYSSYVAILFGPTFFNSARFFGRWKWTFQFFLTIPLGCCRTSSTTDVKESSTKKKEDDKKEEKKDKEDKKIKEIKKEATPKAIPKPKAKAASVKKSATRLSKPSPQGTETSGNTNKS